MTKNSTPSASPAPKRRVDGFALMTETAGEQIREELENLKWILGAGRKTSDIPDQQTLNSLRQVYRDACCKQIEKSGNKLHDDVDKLLAVLRQEVLADDNKPDRPPHQPVVMTPTSAPAQFDLGPTGADDEDDSRSERRAPVAQMEDFGEGMKSPARSFTMVAVDTMPTDEAEDSPVKATPSVTEPGSPVLTTRRVSAKRPPTETESSMPANKRTKTTQKDTSTTSSTLKKQKKFLYRSQLLPGEYAFRYKNMPGRYVLRCPSIKRKCRINSSTIAGKTGIAGKYFYYKVDPWASNLWLEHFGGEGHHNTEADEIFRIYAQRVIDEDDQGEFQQAADEGLSDDNKNNDGDLYNGPDDVSENQRTRGAPSPESPASPAHSPTTRDKGKQPVRAVEIQNVQSSENSGIRPFSDFSIRQSPEGDVESNQPKERGLDTEEVDPFDDECPPTPELTRRLERGLRTELSRPSHKMKKLGKREFLS